MREHYDFGDSVPSPYTEKIKKQKMIRLDQDVIGYFKKRQKKWYPISKPY